MEEEKKIEAEEPTEILGNTGVIEPVTEEPVTAPAVEAPVVEETPAEQPVAETPVEETPVTPAEPETAPIEQPAPESAPVVAPAPEAPKKKSPLPIILVVVLLLAVGGFAVWYFVLGGNGSKEPKPQENPTTEPTDKPEPSNPEPTETVPAKTEDDIKKLYTNVFNAEEDLTAAFYEVDGIGALYTNSVKSLFGKEKVLFSSLNLDEDGKFEFAIHSASTAEIYQIRDTYESLFGDKSFEYKEYKTNSGMFTCGHDEVVYTCVTNEVAGGIAAEPSKRLKYASFTQDGKTIDIKIIAILCDGQKCYSIKDNTELFEVKNDKPFDEANKDIYSKYTYKATFEIDGDGYKFISVEPEY